MLAAKQNKLLRGSIAKLKDSPITFIRVRIICSLILRLGRRSAIGQRNVIFSLLKPRLGPRYEQDKFQVCLDFLDPARDII